jgi:protein-S-isoprenylcysteine O-methyltransferase Ste14
MAMPFRSPSHFILLFFLGGVFIHFTQAGGRTFYSQKLEDEPGANIGSFTFMLGGTLPTWFLGLYQPIHRTTGILAAILVVFTVALYEWARHTIWGQRFGLGWGEHVPEALCDRGPYRLVRHPIYLSYMLAFGAVLIAMPHWLTALMFAVNVALFTHAAITDERTLARSSLATQYAAYRQRVGMFWPRLRVDSRSATPL